MLTVLGLDGAGPVVAAARALCGSAIQRAVISTAGMGEEPFRFATAVGGFENPNFVPGGAKYGDLPGMLALAAPASTLIIGETPVSLELTVGLYRKAAGESNLELMEKSEPGRTSEKVLSYVSRP